MAKAKYEAHEEFESFEYPRLTEINDKNNLVNKKKYVNEDETLYSWEITSNNDEVQLR
jgi:hypothetical protein